MNSPKSLILRVGVVIFAISLLAGYVVFSQTRAKPRADRVNRAISAPGTKSAPVFHRQSSDPQSDLTDIITSSIIDGPIFSSRKASDTNVPPAEPAIDTGLKLDLADSWMDGETVMSSTKSAPVFRPIRFPYDWWTLHLRWFKPRAAPQPLIMEAGTVSTSQDLVDLVPKDAALEPLDPHARPLPSSPGSKSLVPLISEDLADSFRRSVLQTQRGGAAMTILGLVLSTGLSLLFLVVLFVPLERMFPAKRQGFWRPDWWTDLFFLLGQYLVWGGLVLGLLQIFRGHLEPVVPAGFRAAVASQPWWLQAIEVVLLSDLVIYWGHRLQHRIGFLWRFHSIHHSAEHLDWLAAHREHPLDTVYTLTLINLPAYVLGFPLETLAGFLAFRGLWAVYIHSNVRLPIGPLRVLVGAPELHHWHHARERFAGNYANISPLMDVIFGTYRCPPHEPDSLGLVEPMPRSYLGQLLHPFRRKSG